MSNFVVNSEKLSVFDPTPSRNAFVGTMRLGPIYYSGGAISEFERVLCAWLAGDRQTNLTVGYVNPHVFNIAWNDRKVRDFLAACHIAAVDGLGVAVAVSIIAQRIQTRTVMTPLFDRVLEKNQVSADAILIGGADYVLHRAKYAINGASRGIRVTLSACGYEPMEEYLTAIENHPECDVILVAMGSPRSEELLLAASKRFTGKLLWNIGGGTLHFYAGTQKRTPHLVSAFGLQWLWRIVHQPSIAPRYVLGTPLYLGRLIATLAQPGKFNT